MPVKKRPNVKIGGCYRDRNKILKQMGFESYDVYRSSAIWRTIRGAGFKRNGKRCVACNGKAAVLHHTDYSEDTLKGLSLSSLVPLCNDCHYAIEFDENGKKRSLRCANKWLAKLADGGERPPKRIKHKHSKEIEPASFAETITYAQAKGRDESGVGQLTTKEWRTRIIEITKGSSLMIYFSSGKCVQSRNCSNQNIEELKKDIPAIQRLLESVVRTGSKLSRRGRSCTRGQRLRLLQVKKQLEIVLGVEAHTVVEDAGEFSASSQLSPKTLDAQRSNRGSKSRRTNSTYPHRLNKQKPAKSVESNPHRPKLSDVIRDYWANPSSRCR